MKKYYFKEKFFKLTDKYPILDENGNEVYFFDQDFKFVGYKAKLKYDRRYSNVQPYLQL